ncbi:MAG: D-alanyl-D-alanine carboxypeptidase family protein [Actinomycetes bacterium]
MQRFTRPPRAIIAVAIALIAALLAIAAPQSAGATGQDNPSSISQLQARRDAIRRQRAAKASQVNAFKATERQVSGALSALSANVSAQRARLEEAQRRVKQAKSDQSAAEAAQNKALRELQRLKVDLRSSAVDAYVNMGSASGMSSLGAKNINDAVNRRTLLSVQANQNIDLVERYRSVQEDLALQRAAATAAAKRAATRQSYATKRLGALNAAFAKQQAFASSAESRVNAALAEAASLAAVDSQLSGTIAARQDALARQLAAAYAASARRSGSNASDDGPAGPPPNIVGSGGIVSVGGIRVSASIAGNLQALLTAARAAGINFSGGGYRDSAAQVALRRAHCGSSSYAIYQAPASSCSPPTARPGASMHERGLAVDFTQGGRTLTRGSSGFAWLRANGNRYGFFNLPSEPWHWSTNGN